MNAAFACGQIENSFIDLPSPQTEIALMSTNSLPTPPAQSAGQDDQSGRSNATSELVDRTEQTYFADDDSACGRDLLRILVGAFIYVMAGGTAVAMWTMNPGSSLVLIVVLPPGVLLVIGILFGWAHAMLQEDKTLE